MAIYIQIHTGKFQIYHYLKIKFEYLGKCKLQYSWKTPLTYRHSKQDKYYAAYLKMICSSGLLHTIILQSCWDVFLEDYISELLRRAKQHARFGYLLTREFSYPTVQHFHMDTVSASDLLKAQTKCLHRSSWYDHDTEAAVWLPAASAAFQSRLGTCSLLSNRLTTVKLLQPAWDHRAAVSLFVQKDHDLEPMTRRWHIWVHIERRSYIRGRQKSDRKSNCTSESKRSKESQPAENKLTEIACGPDSAQWTKSFWQILYCFLQLYSPGNGQFGTLLWKTKRFKFSLVFQGKEEEKESLQPLCQSSRMAVLTLF